MNAKIRPVRRRWPEAIYDEVEAMLGEDPIPSHRDIADRLQADGRWEATPTDRAIGDWVRKGWVAPPMRSDPWALSDAQPEDIPLVLDVIRLVQAVRRGPVTLSKPTADWIIRLRRAFPDLVDLGMVYRLALRAARGVEGERDVQTVVVYQPWSDQGHRLVRAIADGVAPNRALDTAGLSHLQEVIHMLEDATFEATKARIEREGQS